MKCHTVELTNNERVTFYLENVIKLKKKLNYKRVVNQIRLTMTSFHNLDFAMQKAVMIIFGNTKTRNGTKSIYFPCNILYIYLFSVSLLVYFRRAVDMFYMVGLFSFAEA